MGSGAFSAWTLLPFLVAPIALPRLYFGFGVLADVLREGPSNVVRLLELPLVIATNEPLVGPGIDEFTLTHMHLHCFEQG